MHYLLAIDQGTTNSRAILFNQSGQLLTHESLPLKQSFPYDGWVEQDAEELFTKTVACCRKVIKKAKIAANEIAAIGISNQRETTIIWDKATGIPIYPAIVWQDRRTSEVCRELVEKGYGDFFQSKTGLLIDPYFSATKIMWLLKNIPEANEKASRGELLFGTVDCFLLWKLTNGAVHASDVTNASRTMLLNIHTLEWDEEILSLLNIPKIMLPEVKDNTADFGKMDKDILGIPIPITGMAGDQQAATIGQVCFQTGMVKVTYGTGCFMLLNTGETCVQSKNRLLSTIAYRIDKQIAYGLEGSIFSAGTTISWIRDSLHFIDTARQSEVLAHQIHDTGGVYLVPAFNGLGAPYWQPDARGAILGLTQNSSIVHIVRAALESNAYQTRDLLEAMQNDSGFTLKSLRVDGGMVANDWLLQFIADILFLNIERPICIETTALGAAYLAGLQIGIFHSMADLTAKWQMQQCFTPKMPPHEREKFYNGWKKAIAAVLIE